MKRTYENNTNISSNERKAFKKAFRETVGYNHDHKCGTCKKFTKWPISNKMIYKCQLLASSSKASDISEDDISCRFYEEAENETNII